MRYSFLFGVIALMGALGPGGCATETTPGRPVIEGYVFWPPAPSEPRIQYLRGISFNTDVEPIQQVGALERLAFGEAAETRVAINKPYGVAYHNGTIYVCDKRGIPALIALDLFKQEMRLIGTGGGGKLANPVDVAVSDDGTIYVSDKDAGAINVYDSKERFAAKFAKRGFAPVGVAVRGDELYVCDPESQQVLVLNRYDGSEVRRIGVSGKEVQDQDADGVLLWPLGIDLDAEGAVYVSDVLAARVTKFDPEGRQVFRLGFLSDTIGGLIRPKLVSVNADGMIFVVDAAYQNVQIFNQDQRLLTYFGGAGSTPGSMYLPAGLCTAPLDARTAQILEPYIHPGFAAETLVIVTNNFAEPKVALYALGSLREGYTVDDIMPTRIEAPTGLGDQPAIEIRGFEPEGEGEEPESDGGGGEQETPSRDDAAAGT